jgi:hypothetical protein
MQEPEVPAMQNIVDDDLDGPGQDQGKDIGDDDAKKGEQKTAAVRLEERKKRHGFL